MNKKIVFLVMLVGILTLGLVCISCGGNNLVGIWEMGDGETIELFKDGTGIFYGISGTWKTESNRLIITALDHAIAMDYVLSDSTLSLTLNGHTDVLNRKK